MSIRIVRLGTNRVRGEGLRWERRPPQGVLKEESAPQDWFDVWFPSLVAPRSETINLFETSLAAAKTNHHVSYLDLQELENAIGVPPHYFGIAVVEWEPRFSAMGKGATNQPELSPATIGETPIVMPSHAMVEQFELLAEPLYEQATNLVAQNVAAAPDERRDCRMNPERSLVLSNH